MNVRSKSRAAKSPSVAPRRQGRPLVDDKRRRILDASLKMFAERGYHGVAVPEVAGAAGVATGTLYHYFETKQQLVNELFRDTKLRLRGALLDNLPAPNIDDTGSFEAWYSELWRRLASFAASDPEAFRFLEMQDHYPYLDSESRHIELSVLVPLWMTGKQLNDKAGGPPIDLVLALLWGAFVGLFKASRMGLMKLDDKAMETARATCWRLLAPEAEAATKGKRTKK